MDPVRWKRARALFQEALERAPASWGVFLDQVCDGDQTLRAEVETLLASHQAAGSFLEAPALAAVEEEEGEEAPVPWSEAPVGTRLAERYELSGELGRGGMGVVYRARDPRLGRDVAVKMIPPSLLTRQMEDRFEREARVVAGMDHPAIVAIHDLGHHDGALFFVMPLVQGTTLRALIRRRALPLGDILEVAEQIAEALDYSHTRGVVHRDIKPENIMVSRDEGVLRVRVMDFGLALGAKTTRLTHTGGLVGTVSYLSPEQVESETVDGRADLYALGVVLYECLAGEPPFTGAVHAILYRILHEAPQPLRARGVQVDEELEGIVLEALAKEPARRYQRGRDMALALAAHRRRLASSQRSTVILAVPEGGVGYQPPELPMVGRDQPWALLQAHLTAALGGEGQLALVSGEAGTGKSRLLAELEKLARARQIIVLHGRFSDRESAFPYQGLCELIQDGLRRASGEVASLPDLTDLAPDLLAHFPVFSEIEVLRQAALGDSGAMAPYAGRRGGDPVYVFELFARTLTRLLAGRPAVLLIENLHIADVSIEALQYILRRLGPTPTLIVGTYRPAEIDKTHPLVHLEDSFRDDPRFLALPLGPLSATAFRRLVELLVGSRALRDDLVSSLFEATDGNPLFTCELVRTSLVSGGICRDESGAWGLSAEVGFAADALPATIQQAVARRLERLPAHPLAIVAAASVLGKSFEYRDLEALLGEATDLDDALDDLIRQGILEEDRKARGDRLRFASGVVRDVLYRELARRKRRTLHRRFAHHLERRYEGRLERVDAQLLHHFAEGDVPDKTVIYAQQLARRSLAAFCPEDALRAVKVGLEFVEEEGVAARQGVEGELLMLRAEAHRAAGDIRLAHGVAQRAAVACEEAGRGSAAAMAALLAAETAWQSRRTAAARRWVDRGLTFDAATESDETRRRLLTLGATVANLGGDHEEARDYLEEIERLDRNAAAEKTETAVPPGGTLVTAVSQPIASLEPGRLKSDEEVEVASCVFETLLATDADGNLVANLAARWEVTEEGRAFVLTLRPEVCFSDGSALTAEALKASLERAACVGSESPAAAFATIAGYDRFRAGESEAIAGIEVRGARQVVFRLTEPLPIFPALLTDPQTAIVRRDAIVRREAEEGGPGERVVETRFLGTGPFRLAGRQQQTIFLERNRRWWRAAPPPLERIELRTSLDAFEIADSLRAGEIDLGRDLLPNDLEYMLRYRRFRGGLLEATKKNVYFVLFNHDGPAAQHQALREALCGVVDTRDLVWRTLGRFAQPATGLIPPGILGQDPGRRRRTLSRARARALLASTGLSPPIQLHTAIHPLLQDRYGSLTTALLDAWTALEVDVFVETASMSSFGATYRENRHLDLLIGRWDARYDDPDSFTYELFHSEAGLLRRYFASPETDQLLERARQERRLGARQVLYRRFERALEASATLLPLFHDVDYRIANPRVRGLELRNTPPYVNYGRVGKVEKPFRPRARRQVEERGELHVPIAASIETLQPAVGGGSRRYEVVAAIFETLTRIDERARTVPHLAASFKAVQGGRSYRFALRPQVRFHDGRGCTARDVRFSFERALQAPHSTAHRLLLPIRGAQALRDGKASGLAGFHILSAVEFSLELERPLAFFPAFLSHPAVSIVPEGSHQLGEHWRDGCVGTGPFRVARFARGQQLDLERNPTYWRGGLPKSERLVFHCGTAPERILEGFRAGRFSLAGDLQPADVEALRRDGEHAGGYRDAPGLSTYFLAFNTKRGALRDRALRRAFVTALDLDPAVRDTLCGLATRAHGIIPPGLLGYEAGRPLPRRSRAATQSLDGLRLRVGIHVAYGGPYGAFWARLEASLAAVGVALEVSEAKLSTLRTADASTYDLVAQRWIADYPDADSFFFGLFHAAQGALAGFYDATSIAPLIEKGRRENDPAQRSILYREVEDEIARQGFLLPLFHAQAYRIAAPPVRGLRLGLAVPEVRYETLAVVP